MTVPPYHVVHIQTEGVTTPNQMMRVTEGTPFTVPAGKLFVVTGLAHNDGQLSGGGEVATVTVRFGGVAVLAADIQHLTTNRDGAATIASVPPGLVAPAGTEIVADLDADGAGSLGVILGYLASDQP